VIWERSAFVVRFDSIVVDAVESVGDLLESSSEAFEVLEQFKDLVWFHGVVKRGGNGIGFGVPTRSFTSYVLL